MVKLDNDWDEILKGEFAKEYYRNLREFLKAEYSSHKVYPSMNNIYNAFRLTSFSNTKVVILGQDPYHGEGQAHGLSFSVMKGVRIPPSLSNIYKEIQSDLSLPMPNHGELSKWANEGVLLLNTCLTVREASPNSHTSKGWEQLTDAVISILNDKEPPLVFLLWGGNAKSKQKLITNQRHLVITSVHPSPLSAHGGFFGNKHFSKTNHFLSQNGDSPIDWQII